jgi:hypothetical protein
MANKGESHAVPLALHTRRHWQRARPRRYQQMSQMIAAGPPKAKLIATGGLAPRETGGLSVSLKDGAYLANIQGVIP